MDTFTNKEEKDNPYEWKIKLKSLERKDYPLKHFSFEFEDKISKKKYLKYWIANMYPKGSPLGEFEAKRLPIYEIQKGKKAGYLKQSKGAVVKDKFRMVVIEENYDDRKYKTMIKCYEPRKQKFLYICTEQLFLFRVTKIMELTGLERFMYCSEFKKLMVLEKNLTETLTVTSPIWKGSHCSAILWIGENENKINMNEHLENIMMKQLLKYQNKQTIIPEKWGPPSTLISIKTDIDFWLSGNTPFKQQQQLISFHVSQIVTFQKSMSLMIHPVKFWKQFKQMEIGMQDYGENFLELGRTFEEKGCFLLAAREITDDEGKKIYRFYRGWHTGEVSVAGGTHKIAILDYPSFLWVENGNMMPLLPEHCILPAMGAICKPLIAGKIPEDREPLRVYNHQHCSGIVEKLKYNEEQFPEITVTGIRVIPQRRFLPIASNYNL